MTWHQWHQTAPISRRMGLSSDLARSNAASPHSCQSMGWWAAERRYGLAESFRRFSGWSVKVAHSLSRRRTDVEALRFAQDDTEKKAPVFPARPGRQKRGRPATTRNLLDGVAGAEIARIERLAARETFVLAMVQADAVLTKVPAGVDVLLIDDGGKIKEADVEILDEAAGFQNAVERGLERFGKLLVLHADRGQFFVGDEHAAHHHDARGDGGEFVFQAGEFLARVHGLDEERFEFLARTLRFGQREKALRWFRGFVLFLVVVFFVCHRDSRSGDS